MTGGMLPITQVVTGSGPAFTPNQLGCLQFVLPFTVLVRNVAMRITVVFGAGTVFNLGIYSADKNTKLIEASFDANSATRQVRILATPVTLSPGVYWFAYAPSATGGQYAAGGPQAVSQNEAFNAPGLAGTAANLMVAGVLPASLGVITGSVANISNIALGIFYP